MRPAAAINPFGAAVAHRRSSKEKQCLIDKRTFVLYVHRVAGILPGALWRLGGSAEGGSPGSCQSHGSTRFASRRISGLVRPHSARARSSIRQGATRMCRNIRTLFNFEPPATEDEIRAASLQFVRK